MSALTATRRIPSGGMSEADLQRLVTDAAAVLGWTWLHVRAGRTARGWAVPVSGPLGAGWPDLVLVRPRDGRLLFLELKAASGRTTPAQDAVHATLRAAGLDVRVVRPADLDGLLEALR